MVDHARRALEANGLGSRAEAIGGDFFVDVPEGDVYLLKQILHDWNDGQCRTILANCARRLAAGGRVYIVEMIIPDDNSPSLASLMDLNTMVMLPGREREYMVLLDAAGLKFERVLQTHSPFQIIEASRKWGDAALLQTRANRSLSQLSSARDLDFCRLRSTRL